MAPGMLVLAVALAACLWCGAASGELLTESAEDELLMKRAAEIDSKERRAMGSSFIRYGRSEQPSPAGLQQKQMRSGSSDVVIRLGRDGQRLSRLRQERLRRLQRLAFLCTAVNAGDYPNPSSAEDKVLRDICNDRPLHPTLPDFV